VATYVSGTTDSSWGFQITSAGAIKSNFTIPASGGNISPDGNTYFVVTDIRTNCRTSSTGTSVNIRFNVGTTASTTAVADFSTGVATTSSYVVRDYTLTSAQRFVIRGGQTYWAGPATNGAGIQTTRSNAVSGFQIYATTNETFYSNQAAYFRLTYNTVPGRVTGLSVDDTTDSSISLSWTAPSTNGGSAITGYRIERSTSSTFSSVTTINTDTTSTSRTITGLSANQTYYFRVSAYNNARAVNNNAIGRYSVAVSGVTVPAVPAPSWITTSPLISAIINQAYSRSVSASDADSYTKTAGASWISVSSTGIVSGIPTVLGNYSVTIQATNTSGSSSRTFSIDVVSQTPFWTDTSLNTDLTLNIPYTTNTGISASNIRSTDPYNVFGSLPAGISFNKSTGNFSGTPTQGGSFPIDVFAYGLDGTTLGPLKFTLVVSYPGKRMTSSGSANKINTFKRFAPGESGAEPSGWKNITFVRRWDENSQSWVNPNN
jgi:large repetitive protein